MKSGLNELAASVREPLMEIVGILDFFTGGHFVVQWVSPFWILNIVGDSTVNVGTT
ncbi:hypothetical protein J2W97_000988 [Paenibacillus jamilae]|uniref:hypothetical protein n=1 Tax=Paenibacillus sp. EKM11P TaxID=2708057 RepID=UPI001A9C1043|nr:hypothetical protein [Paenibacillus sp. EKM11P]MDP9675005.1 hypothetical protein [Paenibacillus jamilae]